MRLIHLRTRTQSSADRRAPLRLAAVALIALAALLTTGVALAQSSAAYDLACRGVLDGGGGQLTAPSGNFGVVGAIGQSPAGESRSPNYGVRGGYVQPGSPPAAATVPTARIAVGDQIERNLLPFLGRVVRTVRGGC